MRAKGNIDQTKANEPQSQKAANDQLRTQIEYLPIEALTPARRNARRHPAEQIRQLMASIDKFGIVTPLLVDAENRLIAGHGRLEALKQLGFAQAPVIPITHLSPKQARLFALADNKIAANASWDEAVLQIELAELRAFDADIQVNSPHRHQEFQMASGEMSAQQYRDFLTAAFRRISDVSSDGSLHFVCHDWRFLGAINAAGDAVFAEQKALIVWAKTNAGMGSLYRSQHELISLYKKGKAPHTNNIQLGRHGRNRTNVWTYPGANAFGKGRDQALKAHPTVKPLALVADALLDVTCPGDVVLDAFAGSGTIILAAEKTGRRARAVEIEPGYVDVAIQRWQAMTGKGAILAGTDLDFATVAAQRSAKRSGERAQ